MMRRGWMFAHSVNAPMQDVIGDGVARRQAGRKDLPPSASAQFGFRPHILSRLHMPQRHRITGIAAVAER